MGLINNRILTDHVYDAIKRMIEEGALAPGVKINRRQLEEILGVSQTPINEALNRLAGEKYLYQESRRGYFVELYSDTTLADLFAVRAAIEGMAARLCAMEASDEEIGDLCGFFSDFTTPTSLNDVRRYEDEDIAFHRAIINYSHNEPIRVLSNNHGYIIKTLQRGLVRRPTETISEHRGILDALAARDAERVQRLMTEHHLKSRIYLEERARNTDTE